MSNGAGTGAGLLGFLGGLLEQSPYTRALMNAGRSGLLAARTGRTMDPEAENLDLGEAFLGVGPAFGYKGARQPQAASTAVKPSQAGGGGGLPLAAPPQLQAPSGTLPNQLTDRDLEAMLSDVLYNPFGRIG